LPSVRKKTLGKEPFADEIFAECSLPSVTLGKAFAVCKIAFAECLRHSAKNAIPVVIRISHYIVSKKNSALSTHMVNYCGCNTQVDNHVMIILVDGEDGDADGDGDAEGRECEG
jgi:hypothetical protein